MAIFFFSVFSLAFLFFIEVQLNLQPLFPGESGVDQLVEIIKVRIRRHPRFSINLDLFILELCNSDILNECVKYFIQTLYVQ